MMIFLTTGEKIRSLRKRFAMRQQELEDENITRAFISMIETGKRGLSKETARHLAEKFNKKAESLRIAFNIDEAYLMRTPAEDAEVYCLQKLNNEPTQDEIDVIINIAKKYHLTKAEAQAYKSLGDYDFEIEDYPKAFINYMISLDMYKNTQAKEFIAYLFNRLGCCKYKKMEYTEAISFFSRGWHYAIMYKDRASEKDAVYNISESYRNLGKYDSALEYIDKYLEMCDKEKDFKEYVAANLLKANCLSLKQNKDKALSVYMKLMEGLKKEDAELLCNVYKAIGMIYLDEDNLDRSLEYFNKVEETVQENDKCTLFDCCIYKAKVYNKKLNFDDALSSANKAVKISGELNDISLAKAAYSQLIEIYTGSGDFTSLKNNYIKLLDIIKNKEEYRDETIRLYNKLALHYLEQNDIEMCKKYLHMAS